MTAHSRIVAAFVVMVSMSSTSFAQFNGTARQRGGFGVAFSPDGKTLAVGGQNQDVVIFDLEKKQSLQTLNGFSAPCDILQFSPDGRLLTGIGIELIVWETADWGVVRKLARKDLEQPLALSVDQAAVASVALQWDGGVRIWDTATGATKQNLRVLSRPYCGAFSPDGRTLAVGTGAPRDGIAKAGVHILGLASGKEVQAISTHPDWISALAFSGDGSRVAFGCGSSKTARLWDLGAHREIREFKGIPGKVEAIRFTPDDRGVVIGTQGKVVITGRGPHMPSDLQIWELEDEAASRTIRATMAGVTTIRWSPDGQKVAWRAAEAINVFDWRDLSYEWRDGFGRELHQLPR